MSNYKETQLTQIENDELRARLKFYENKVSQLNQEIDSLSNKNSHAFYLVKKEDKLYTIYDEKGYTQDSFISETDTEAKKFFETYKQEKRDSEISVIASSYDGDNFYSLSFIKFQIVSLFDVKPTLIHKSRYMIYRDGNYILSLDLDATEEEAIAKYNETINEYKKNKNQKKLNIII